MQQQLIICLAFAVYLALTVRASPSNDNPDGVTPKKLQVKVYYETLCKDSVSFITGQLYNAMTRMKLLQYTDLQFVPYGKVTKSIRNGVTSLKCQHGHRECELNALHACIIENNNAKEQYKMITCALRRFKDVDQCSRDYRIDVSAAKFCKRNNLTADILEKYGKDTQTIPITFVPSIKIDGVFRRAEQNEILNNFANIFCRKYKQKFNITLENCS